LVGRVTKALQQSGLYKNTVIVFSSDNGGDPNFGGSNLPLRGKKETLWDGGLRVPSFVHSPLLFGGANGAAASALGGQQQRRGAVSNQLFHMTDWLPTLLRASGLRKAVIDKLKGRMDGVDQWEALREVATNGKLISPPPRTAVVLNMNKNPYGRLEAAYRDGPYKLMINMMRAPNDWLAPLPPNRPDLAANAQLFNVVNDPSERVNLAGNLTEITGQLAQKVTIFLIANIENKKFVSNANLFQNYPRFLNPSCAGFVSQNRAESVSRKRRRKYEENT
jgi:arylsulfatase A-like enzyme